MRRCSSRVEEQQQNLIYNSFNSTPKVYTRKIKPLYFGRKNKEQEEEEENERRKEQNRTEHDNQLRWYYQRQSRDDYDINLFCIRIALSQLRSIKNLLIIHPFVFGVLLFFFYQALRGLLLVGCCNVFL